MQQQPTRRIRGSASTRWRAGLVRLALAAVAVAAHETAWAALALDVRVLRGGGELNFGTVSLGETSRSEEVELGMTSSGPGPYRVSQELPGMLVNERGDRLPDGVFVMQTSRGLSGTRSFGGIVPVSEHAQELFVSNAAGSSDTVLLSYAIMPTTETPAGTYRGVLRFAAEGLGTGTVATRTLRVNVVIPAAVRLERTAGPSHLMLDAAEPEAETPANELVLGITSNVMQRTQLLQDAGELINGERGATLPHDALRYRVRTTDVSGDWRPVGAGTEPIATGDQGTLRELQLGYKAVIPPDQLAGTYRGMLRLSLMHEGGAGTGELLIPIEVTVKEVFMMSVTSIDGAGGVLQFERPFRGDGPIERRMQVEVRSNTGRPYQMLAGLDHALVLPSGEALPVDALVWAVAEGQHGRALIPGEAPVNRGYQPIYESDAHGRSDRFILRCRLLVPADAKDGVYSGRLRFTMTMYY